MKRPNNELRSFLLTDRPFLLSQPPPPPELTRSLFGFQKEEQQTISQTPFFPLKKRNCFLFGTGKGGMRLGEMVSNTDWGLGRNVPLQR
mmetsp:Transcript_50387/g.50743  ORF Transcript_50387/g.50743 Transcript_50387/m.50743 type:complete len:89 (+) Transcript_50387:163-429(+)